MAKVTDSLYAELRRRIMSGFYAPGQHLREKHISEEMQVSRTPVRAALEKLGADGLVSFGNRGAVVAGWTQWDITEIYELRLVLEPLAAGLAAIRATDEQVAELEALCEEMKRLARSSEPERIERIQENNNRFHHLLVDAAGSGRLRNTLQNFLDIPIMIGSFYFYSKEELQESASHHAQIVDAVKMRSRKFATEAMAFHLRASFMRFESQRVTGKGA